MKSSKSPQETDTQIRLNKFLALNLGISRREADDLIAGGKVKVDEKTATLGARISPSVTVVVNGKSLNPELAKFEYLLFNKPTGYVCSRKQQGDAPTIYSLLPRKFHHLKPVGRLDKDSSGLILLTNDGDFSFRMTHPKFAKSKIYRVRLDRALEPLHQQMISDFGVNLPDGRSQLILQRLDETRKSWQITMSEGRNRQIRRTFAALGYDVVKLHRTNFGNYSLDDIKRGEWKIFDIS